MSKNNKTMKKDFPVQCPSCGGELVVTGLSCAQCGTAISGSFTLPPLLRLNAADLAFATDFVKCGGSLKGMSQKLGLSYPTVRNLLDDVIAKITALEGAQNEQAE